MISIIVPTKDRPDILDSTLSSLVAQTIEHEILVCDDNSLPENSRNIRKLCERYGATYLLNPGPYGVSCARNYAVEQSTSEYVAFCDDDDFWMPRKLNNQSSVLKSQNRQWVYSSVVIVNENFQPIGFQYGSAVEGESMLSGNRIPGGCSGVMIERDLFNNVGGFDEELKIFADWDLWIRLNQISIPAASRDIDIVYMQHNQQMSLNGREARQEVEKVFDKHNVNRSDFSEALLDIDKWIARRCAIGDQVQEALLHVWKNKNRVDLHVLKLFAVIFSYKLIKQSQRVKTIKDKSTLESFSNLVEKVKYRKFSC